MIDLTANEDYVRGATTTADGGTVVVGMSQNPDQPKASIIRLDSAGTISWIKLVDGTIYQTADYVVELPDSTILVVGSGYDQFNGDYRQAPLLFKLNADGSLLWSKQLHPPSAYSNMYAYNLHIDSAGYCYVSGYLLRMEEAEVYDNFVTKINQTGQLLWGSILINGNKAKLPTRFVVGPSGEVLIRGGLTLSAEVFGETTFGLFTAELDSLGEFVSGKQILSEGLSFELLPTLHSQQPASYATDAFMGGYVNYSDSSSDSSYAFVARFDDALAPLWVKSYHDPVARIVEGTDEIRPLGNGNLLINFTDKLGYQNLYSFPDPNEDVVLAELTPQGEVVSTRRVGTTAREENNRLALHADGSIDVATTGQYLNDELRGVRNVLLTHFESYQGAGPACVDSTLSINLEVNDLAVEVSPLFIEMAPYDSLTPVDLIAYDAPDVIVRPLCDDCPADVRARPVASSVPCGTDSLAFEVELCNYGCQPLPAGLSYTLYAADPRQTTTAIVHTDTLPLALPPTLCRRVRLPLLTAADYILVANDPGQSVTPFDPISVLIDSSRLESDYANNFIRLRGPIDYALTDSLVLCYGDTAQVAGQLVTSAGTYTLVSSSQTGCDSTHTYVVAVRDSIRATLQVEPYFSLDQAGTVSVSDFSGGGGGPYTVSWDDGYTGASRNDLLPGDYVLAVTSAPGCTRSFVVRVEVGTAITTMPPRSHLSAYPNPVAAGGVLVVRQSGHAVAQRYAFVDVHGRVVPTRRAGPRSVGSGVALTAPEQRGLYLLRPVGRAGRLLGVVLRVVVQ